MPGSFSARNSQISWTSRIDSGVDSGTDSPEKSQIKITNTLVFLHLSNAVLPVATSNEIT